MEKHRILHENPDIKEIHDQLESWRNQTTRGKSIPQHLWDSAAKLAKKHSVATISNILRLNHTDLKKRVVPSQKKKQTPSFVELDMSQSPFLQECTLEMEDNRGAKLKVHIKGHNGIDLERIGRAFWGK